MESKRRSNSVAVTRKAGMPGQIEAHSRTEHGTTILMQTGNHTIQGTAFWALQIAYLREDAGSGVVCLYDDMLVELGGVHAQ